MPHFSTIYSMVTPLHNTSHEKLSTGYDVRFKLTDFVSTGEG